jgi:hypothetical protein
MRRALAILVVLTCAAVAGLGAAGATAAGIVPVEGPWHATTSAGLPVRFTVTGNQVSGFRFRFNWGFCGTYTNNEGSQTVTIEEDGHWKDFEGSETFVEATFVAPDRAEGVVGAPSRETPGCPGTRAKFVAEPGAVPFNEPPVEVLANVRTHKWKRKPKTIVLRRDGSLRFYGLHWRGWGEGVTHASGHAYIKSAGVVRRPRATLTLSELTQSGAGKVYYQLNYTFHGRLPSGVRRHGEHFML